VNPVFGLGVTMDLWTRIGQMANWVREHGAWPPVEFGGMIEIERNHPPSWR
jgi:hypothetical protein